MTHWSLSKLQAEIEEGTCNDSLHGVAGVDQRNAYGMFLRSHALRACSDVCLPRASWAATEFSNESSQYWQVVDGRWVSGRTSRGYWQGRKLAMLLFCSSLVPVWDACPDLFRDGKVAVVGIQDDTYLCGNMWQISTCWDGLCNALNGGGHEVNNRKSEFWVSALDAMPVDSLPSNLSCLAAKISRTTGGVKALRGSRPRCF